MKGIDMERHLVVTGEPASKANGRRVVRIGGVSRSIKSKKALSYADAFLSQVQPLLPLMEGELAMTLHIYYASQRPDLDESLILDLLQGILYKNDRQVRERHVYHYIDKLNPRTEIWIRPRATT
jgi:Holliday junction resolvase RusA-like endonuclease